MDAEQMKKRKLDLLNEEEEEESETEEAKMEKFYELIRISKELRARMMKINGERMKLEEEKTSAAGAEAMIIMNANKNNNDCKKKMKNDVDGMEKSSVEEGGAWNPTFRPEDFFEDGIQFHVNIPHLHSKMTGTAASSSNKHEEQQADDDDGEGRSDHNHNNGLDLNLSL